MFSRQRGRRSWPQRLLIVMNLAVMVGLVAAAAGLGYTYTKFGRLPRVEIGDVLAAEDEAAAATTGAQNFLIVGVDSADGLDPEDPVRSKRAEIGGLRSDTTMILRVDPASTRAALLSIPRDLYVPISGTGGTDRINAAVNLGGPERLINTIQDHFGIPINHYLQIDFVGFRGLVEVLDGVPIYFPRPVRDTKSGLHVPEAGCITLDPANALGFVRSRSYQEKVDGRWRFDGTGDLGRVRRQQEFIQVALKRAVEKGLRNPVKLDSLIDSALNAITVDDTLTPDDVLDLARQFQKFEPGNLDLYSLPVTSDTVGGASILRLQTRAAEPTLDIFRGRVEGALVESSVQVSVLNGTGGAGEATSVRSLLNDAGFATGITGNAETFEHPVTEVRYPPGTEAEADLVLRWLVAGAQLVPDDTVDGVTVVTGSDFAGVRDAPLAPSSTTSTTATTLPTTTTTALDPEQSTTTVIGTIPLDAPEDVSCG